MLTCPNCGNTTFEVIVPDIFIAVDEIEGFICSKCELDYDEAERFQLLDTNGRKSRQ